MKHTLTRTGNRPLAFEGEQIAHESTQIVNGKDHNRWHEITLYRAASSKFVIHIAYRTQWQGELDHDDAEAFNNTDEMIEWIRTKYSPGQFVSGFPEGPQFNYKRGRALHDLWDRYHHAVSHLLKEFPEDLDAAPAHVPVPDSKDPAWFDTARLTAAANARSDRYSAPMNIPDTPINNPVPPKR
jgi:hypothetical protein